MTIYLWLLGLMACLVGSFLNVVIYRLPMMLQAEWRSQCAHVLGIPPCESDTVTLSFPRSFCPACNNKIPIWHNIPIISYCILRGKCAMCHQTISWRYPLVEVLTLLLSLYAGIMFGFNERLFFALLFIWSLICITFIDFRHQLIPDGLSLGLLWLGLIANTHALFTPLPEAVLSAAGGYLFLWGFIQLYALLTGKIGMGRGDFKLFAAFGAWFGWTQLPLILLLAASIGAVFGIGYLLFTKQSRETAIPFGPALCLAGLIILYTQ